MIKKIVEKKLGQLLIESGVINQRQLEEALLLQKKEARLIGQILVRLGYAKEEEIARALTVQYGFPYLPLDDYRIDPATARLVPRQLAERYGLVAVDRLADLLTVAVCDPLNDEALKEVKKHTRLNVQVFVSTHTDIDKAIERSYPS